MSAPFRTYVLLVIAFCAALPLRSASAEDLPARTETKRILLPADSVIQLARQFVAVESDTLLIDSLHVPRDGGYTINYRLGRVTLSQAFRAARAPDSATVTISYRYFPFEFEESYFRRKLVVLRDSTGKDTLRISQPRSKFGLDEIFGENLQKSGSIVRGFTVGSNRDFSLNSGLRLQLAGKIASDIEVVAALTDENTPIQPEGTTQTLQEFDKVFVELRSTDVSATLGDFHLDFAGTEFARLSRKLQGAKSTAEYRLGPATGITTAAAATTRGKYNTLQVMGQDAVQGPYRLTGRNNERQIIVIAGTERVYVDGELQTRGETNDYTIDYSTGELTFTTRRLITSASRITVDFEYTDRQFSRSLLAAQNSTRFFDDKAALTVSFLREGDDPDGPIDFSLSDSARTVLQNAGDRRSAATVSGISKVDSNGFYIPDSAVVDGVLYRFFRYAPGKNAQYVINFSSVPFGQGEYIRQSVGAFEWKGPGRGDYLPVQFLPMPQLTQVLDFNLSIKPLPELDITGEYAASTFDANRLSTLDDEDNGGHAVRFGAAYSPKNVMIGDLNVGSFDLKVSERYVNNRFVPIDRTNDIEFNRKWGIETITQSNEEIQEASLRYAPVAGVSVTGGYGKILRGSDLRSVRNDARLSVLGDSLPTINYYIESVRTKEVPTDNSSTWTRQKGDIQQTFGRFVPFFKFEREEREIRLLSTDSLKDGSFAFNVFSPGVRIKDFWRMSFSAQMEWRTDDRFTSGAVVRESKSFTQSYAWRLADWNTITSSLDVTLRDRTFSDVFKARGNKDIKTVLVRNQTRLAPLNRGIETDLFYEVATERSSRLERVFVRVAVGSGNYKYLGDLNRNGIADEAEFVQSRFDGDYITVTVPSDILYPVIDLKTSARLRVTPSRFLTQSGALHDLVSPITTETYVRVEEKSTEPDLKKIYLLHFSRFQGDSTIAGSTLFTQDVNVFEGKPEFAARFRYSQRKGLNRFASSTSGGTEERSYTRERSVRLRWQLVSEIANQIDYVNRIDRVSSTEASLRVRNVTSNSLTFDLSYRPYQQVEVGMKFEIAKAQDDNRSPAVTSDLNTQAVRMVYAFQGAGQARVEVAREEVLLGNATDNLPFELTGGRLQGKTYLWRAGFDYRVTQFIQATLNYDGRSEGGRSPVHTARAEVRAFF